ncbi:MAG: DUF3108 domain-containing protein [Pseudomonadota bacterium]
MSFVHSGTRRWWLLAIAAIVVLLHMWLTSSMSDMLHTLRPGDSSSIQRMEAAYVSQLKLSAPPVVAPTAPVPRPKAARRAKKAPRPPAKRASAPEPAPSQAELADSQADAASAVVAEVTASAVTAASAPSTPSTASSTAQTPPGPAFVWPLATRVSYKLHGFWRGDIYGTSKVEWVRQDLRYQVRLDASFGPLGSMNFISEGDITPEGLAPRRFEQINRLLIKTSPPRSVTFEENDVVLDSGERVKRLPLTQDGASVLIQLAYQFMLRPGLLSPGNTVEIPLASAKKLQVIAFDVIKEEVLDTPIGKVPTFHVKPRKMDTTGGTLAMEVWFAPGLQYLPVRISFQGRRDKEDVSMDMQMDRAPEQNAAPTEASSSPH